MDSPATRLPEADSLPDGFVDGPSADQALPLSSAPFTGEPPHPAHVPDHDAVTVVDGAETLGAPSPLDLAAAGLQSLSMNVCLGQQGPAGDTGVTDAKESVKGNSAVEPAESLTNQKVVNAEIEREIGEPKRKVVKRSSKLEKDRELFELAQRYHRVVAERDAAIAVKEKLESLCREFQRQNKMVKEECQRVSIEGQNMRMDLSDKFNNAIKDVSVKLEAQKNEGIAQLEENIMLRSKLKDLSDQYDIIQQNYAHQLKEKSLELELADLKTQQHQSQMTLYADQVSQLVNTEKNLRLQLAADGEKFQQFQEALSKSNGVFETYKKEMDQMVKMIKTFRKENENLKAKCENSDIALVKLIEERELMKKQIEKIKNQKERLESLCRSLQAERKQSTSLITTDLNQPDPIATPDPTATAI